MLVARAGSCLTRYSICATASHVKCTYAVASGGLKLEATYPSVNYARGSLETGSPPYGLSGAAPAPPTLLFLLSLGEKLEIRLPTFEALLMEDRRLD